MAIEVVRGSFSIQPAFDWDMRLKRRWSLQSDSREKEGDFIPQLVNITRSGACLSGKDLLKWSKRHKGIGGQRHLEALVREQNLVPDELCHCYVLAPKTVWIDSNNGNNIIVIPYLYWLEGICGIDFTPIDLDFDWDIRILMLL